MAPDRTKTSAIVRHTYSPSCIAGGGFLSNRNSLILTDNIVYRACNRCMADFPPVLQGQLLCILRFNGRVACSSAQIGDLAIRPSFDTHESHCHVDLRDSPVCDRIVRDHAHFIDSGRATCEARVLRFNSSGATDGILVLHGEWHLGQQKF